MSNQFTIYRSVDSGAPALSGTNGSLVALLDACLVNGWTASVTSIARSGSLATVTTATAHGLSSGNSTTISGAVETDYNGTFVVTVTGTTAFTFTVGGTPSTPATGTILWKKLGAGWTKPYTGTNKAAFKQGTGSAAGYLRCQDDGPGAGTAKEARLTGYETMSDVDTGTGPMPTAAQGLGSVAMVVWRKSTTADATARTWILVADARTVYLFVLTGDVASNYYGGMYGEFYDLVVSGAYRNMIVGRGAENSGTQANDRLDLIALIATAATSQHYIQRGHTGTGGSVAIGVHGEYAQGQGPGALVGSSPYPNPADGGLLLSPVWIHDPVTTTVNGVRGRMRGFWHFLHPIASVADADIVSGLGDLSGKSFLFIKQSGNAGVYCIETSATLESN